MTNSNTFEWVDMGEVELVGVLHKGRFSIYNPVSPGEVISAELMLNLEDCR